MSTKLTAQQCARAIRLAVNDTPPVVWVPETQTRRQLTPGEITRGRRYIDRTEQRHAFYDRVQAAHKHAQRLAAQRARRQQHRARIESARVGMAAVAQSLS